MASYNRIIMMGNLTRDPEYKQLSSGQAVCRFGLASNRQFKNKQTGSMVQEVCFIDVDVWGAQAESCNQYLQKGRSVLVEGRLKLDNWEGPDGIKRSKHSIVADRVTFLASGVNQSDDVSADGASDESSSSMSVASEGSKILGEPAKRVKAKSTRSVGEEAQTSTGEIDFKDEKPFEDELPF